MLLVLKSNLALDTFMDGGATASLDSLCQGLTTLTGENFFFFLELLEQLGQQDNSPSVPGSAQAPQEMSAQFLLLPAGIQVLISLFLGSSFIFAEPVTRKKCLLWHRPVHLQCLGNK